MGRRFPHMRIETLKSGLKGLEKLKAKVAKEKAEHEHESNCKQREFEGQILGFNDAISAVKEEIALLEKT